jgi:hypothetical protein
MRRLLQERKGFRHGGKPGLIQAGAVLWHGNERGNNAIHGYRFPGMGLSGVYAEDQAAHGYLRIPEVVRMQRI